MLSFSLGRRVLLLFLPIGASACSIYDDTLLQQGLGEAETTAVSRGGTGHCESRTRDADETDVDCGGLDCPPCSSGRGCAVSSDCANLSCAAGACQPPSCTDGDKNASETDIDCGGEDCIDCSAGRRCRQDYDCDSQVCAGGVCAAPTCGDRVQNGGESDVDCGGPCERGCESGQACSTALDCSGPASSLVDEPMCSKGTCSLSCTPGWGDCNGLSTDGCEVDLKASATHCGSCASPCVVPHTEDSACVAGACTIVVCAEGFADCNGDAVDGCETNIASDGAHCGACAARCSNRGGAPSCVSGVCQIACAEGFRDCDGEARHSGCETDISRHALHCSECESRCVATGEGEVAYCKDGACGTTVCDPGWGDCDGDGACTDPLNGAQHCGGCGQTCDVTGGVGRCEAAACVIDECPEARNDCDKLFATGCESDPLGDVQNCGACGTACGGTGANAHGASCVDGVCVVTCEAGFCSDTTAEAACGEAQGTGLHCLYCGDSCGRDESCTEVGCSRYRPITITAQKDFSSLVDNGWKSVGTYTLSQNGSATRALLLLAATTVSNVSMDARISWGSTYRPLSKIVTTRVKQTESGVFALLDAELPAPGTTVTLWFWAADWWGGFVGTLLEVENLDQLAPTGDKFSKSQEICDQVVRESLQIDRPGGLVVVALNVNYDSNRDGSPHNLAEIRDSYQTSQTNGLFGLKPLATEDLIVGWDVDSCWRWSVSGVVFNPAPITSALFRGSVSR